MTSSGYFCPIEHRSACGGYLTRYLNAEEVNITIARLMKVISALLTTETGLTVTL